MTGGAPFRVERLSNHDRTAFASGEPTIDRWFREQAGQMSSRGLAVVHVMIEAASGSIVGYYSLSNFTVAATDLPEALSKRMPRRIPLPAHLIGHLGIDVRHQ